MIRYFNCKMFLCIDALVSGFVERKIRVLYVARLQLIFNKMHRRKKRACNVSHNQS